MSKSKKPFCIHGHEIAVVGRDKQGNCMGCTRPVLLGLKSPHPKKQICRHGHDTAVCGRDKSGACKDCKNIDSCKRQKEVKEGKRKIKHTKQFCIHGHDTFVTGFYKDGSCIECVKIRDKERYQNNKDEILAYNKIYYQNNKEKILTQVKEWYLDNLEQILLQKKKYVKNRKAIDINFRLACNLRTRLNSALKNNSKLGSAVRDLGCPIEFFKDYIATKFHDGMTWGNYGSYWELDHIKELADFDLTDRKQFLEAVNYKNYQPLTIEEHKKKTAIGITKRAKLGLK
jgi:hypothetical protein